jgi:hypothetical protein
MAARYGYARAEKEVQYVSLRETPLAPLASGLLSGT